MNNKKYILFLIWNMFETILIVKLLTIGFKDNPTLVALVCIIYGFNKIILMKLFNKNDEGDEDVK